MNKHKHAYYGIVLALALQTAAPMHAGIWSSISEWFSSFSQRSKNTVYVVSAAVVACCGAFGLWKLASNKNQAGAHVPSAPAPQQPAQPLAPYPAIPPAQPEPHQVPVEVPQSAEPSVGYRADAFLNPLIINPAPSIPAASQSAPIVLEPSQSVGYEVLPGIYDVPARRSVLDTELSSAAILAESPLVSSAQSMSQAEPERAAASVQPAAEPEDSGYGVGLHLIGTRVPPVQLAASVPEVRIAMTPDPAQAPAIPVIITPTSSLPSQVASALSSAAQTGAEVLSRITEVATAAMPSQEQVSRAGVVASDLAVSAGSSLVSAAQAAAPVVINAGSAAASMAASAGSSALSAAQAAAPVVKDAAVAVGNGAISVGQGIGAHVGAAYARIMQSPDIDTAFKRFEVQVIPLVANRENLNNTADTIRRLNAQLRYRYDHALKTQIEDELAKLRAIMAHVYTHNLKQWGQSLIRRYDEGYPGSAQTACKTFIDRVRQECSINTLDGQRLPIDDFELYTLLNLADAHPLRKSGLSAALAMAHDRREAHAARPEITHADINKFKKLLSTCELYDSASLEELGAYLQDQQQPKQQKLQGLSCPGKPHERAAILQWLEDIQKVDTDYRTLKTEFSAIEEAAKPLLASYAKEQAKRERKEEKRTVSGAGSGSVSFTPSRDMMGDRERKSRGSRAESKRPEGKRAALVVAH
jgi:hypothetical protein